MRQWKRWIACLIVMLASSLPVATPAGAQDTGPAAQEALLPFRYVRAWERQVPVYSSAGDPGEMAPTSYLLPPDSWVSIAEEVEKDGRLWYQTGDGSFVQAADLAPGSVSTFQGIVLQGDQPYPTGFVVAPRLNVRARPGLAPDNPPVGALTRYQPVTILGSVEAPDGIWYRIGENQFVYGPMVRVVHPVARPADVLADDRWIAVDLAQQTLAAYEGDRMVFATLVSTGRPPWYTPNGLFRIWIKLQTGDMQGGLVERGDYYSLQNVPWIMYFSRDVGLHGTYWHDRFGAPTSHGCVNLSPLDSRWLFDWVSPQLHRPGQPYAYSQADNLGTWVYVYASSG